MDYPISTSIKKWAEADRPREKLLKNGRNLLTDAELMAILISSGNKEESAVELSKRILRDNENSLNRLGKLSVSDLMKFKGIGEAKAITIIASLELGRRRKGEEAVQKQKIGGSKDAFEILNSKMEDLSHEEFWILLLNRANRIIKVVKVSSGGISGTVADVKMIFNLAIESLASGIILSHNHPSGNLNPSKSDNQLTKKMVAAGQILEVPVLDHIIIGDNDYFSFADNGMI